MTFGTSCLASALRRGALAVFAGIALTGCLPEASPSVARTPSVVPENSAPTIGGVPAQTATAGSYWQFQPSAGDTDGDVLTFAASWLPAWASLDPQSGLVSGIPSHGDVGTSAAIIITVSDGEASASLAAFSITVAAAAAPSLPSPPPPASNRAPVIGGTPSHSVMVGASYVFAPTASDPDGDTLMWSISGKPAAASFSTSTGRLTWTPAAPGNWTGIVITVTDGTGASASLPAFSITVSSPPVRGSATLSWTAPLHYADGSVLPEAELTAYRIFHAREAGSLAPVAEVDGRTTAFTMGELEAGTHYFAVTAIAGAGAESAFSAIGSKTIP